MNRNAPTCCFIAIIVFGLAGCSSAPPAESKKVNSTPDKIQGKSQIVLAESSAGDAALNAGGPSVYLWDGIRRYRLFFKSPMEVIPGKEYIAEGVLAQKAIDEIGDPDQGKNGYPLEASCERIVRTAWSGMPFDVTDGHASGLRSRVKRYPARPVLLVNKLTLVSKEGAAADSKKDGEVEDEDLPEVAVTSEKQGALKISGPTVLPAPLWERAGGTVNCKVIIGKDGKIFELETGSQLCEAVPWDQFSYPPPVHAGKPIKVKSEVEVRFDPRA